MEVPAHLDRVMANYPDTQILVLSEYAFDVPMDRWLAPGCSLAIAIALLVLVVIAMAQVVAGNKKRRGKPAVDQSDKWQIEL